VCVIKVSGKIVRGKDDMRFSLLCLYGCRQRCINGLSAISRRGGLQYITKVIHCQIERMRDTWVAHIAFIVKAQCFALVRVENGKPAFQLWLQQLDQVVMCYYRVGLACIGATIEG